MELYLLLVVDDAEFLYCIVSLLKCVCLFIEISRLFSSLIMKYRTRKAIDSVVNLIFLPTKARGSSCQCTLFISY